MSIETILSVCARERAHTHTQIPAHTGTRTHEYSDKTKYLHNLNGQQTENMPFYCFGKRNGFRLDLNESREGFCRRGRGRSFHVDGPKTEKAEGTNSGESGARNVG